MPGTDEEPRGSGDPEVVPIGEGKGGRGGDARWEGEGADAAPGRRGDAPLAAGPSRQAGRTGAGRGDRVGGVGGLAGAAGSGREGGRKARGMGGERGKDQKGEERESGGGGGGVQQPRSASRGVINCGVNHVSGGISEACACAVGLDRGFERWRGASVQIAAALSVSEGCEATAGARQTVATGQTAARWQHRAHSRACTCTRRIRRRFAPAATTVRAGGQAGRWVCVFVTVQQVRSVTGAMYVYVTTCNHLLL
jgi:hypothetical protein